MNPHYGDLDTYHMAASAIDEAIRNCVAVGADPSRIAILDNFCWGDCERPETLGSLVRAAMACYDLAVGWGTPFISGKDSLNNEFSFEDANGRRQTIAIPPSLLISALGQVADVRRCVTMDLKAPGNLLYQVGATQDELGGSHWALVRGLDGGNVPKVDVAGARRTFAAVHAAIEGGLVRACHDLSEGGLAVAAAEMAFAGGYGATIDPTKVPCLAPELASRPELVLFSESNTRFVCEVETEKAAAFEDVMGGIPCTRIGQVTDIPRLRIGDWIDADIVRLKEAWQSPLKFD
jgi:phosphoribosylformylglycinamidine synthase